MRTVAIGIAALFLATGTARAAEPKVRMWYCPHERGLRTTIHWTGPGYRGGLEHVSVETARHDVGNVRMHVQLTKYGAYLNGKRCPRDFVAECYAAREAAGVSPEGCGE